MNLTLNVIEAKNLNNVGSIRTSDPYCKVRVNNEKKRTRVVHNTVNPRWDDRFYFENVPQDSAVSIEIYDKNLIKSNRFMGKIHTDVTRLRNNPKAWWPLFGRSGESAMGSIYVEAEFL